jgi:hypothetical protein
VHVPVPPQPDCPLQPAKVLPLFGVAVSVTCNPVAKLAVQADPQLMPAGLLTTVPVPLPAFVTVKLNAVAVNVAVADCAEFIVMVHVLPPQDCPPHPENVLPLAGVSVNVTCAPWAKFAVQVVGQLMPDGLLTTVPLPVPASVTVNAKLVAVLNVAVTL